MEVFVIGDTHRLIGNLLQRGFTAQQAQGITEALRELDASALPTKSHLQQIKVDLVKWIVGTRLACSTMVVGFVASVL